MNSRARLASAAVAGLSAVLAGRAIRRREAIDFAGKVVVITGGSRGLGLVMAREWAADGARLALLARDTAELKRAEDDLVARSAEVLAIPCDLRNQDEAQGAIRCVLDR